MGLAFASAFGINPSINHSPGTYSTRSVSSISSTTISSTITSTSSTSSTSSASSPGPDYGKLSATFSVGPTQPVCYVSATEGPASSYFSSIEAVVTDSQGQAKAHVVSWVSNGCNVTGTFSTLLPTGRYSLNLSSCSWMGCKSALPRDFVIQSGITTDAEVSIFTGIV